jgi:hypothetical protein
MPKKRTAWNKGKRWSVEVRHKLSESHKGQKLTEEQKKKIGNSIRGRKHTPEAIERMKVAQGSRSPEWREKIAFAKLGSKNPLYGKKGILAPQWKGGITPVNAAIRNSPQMAQWRLSVFERDDFTCQGCGIRGGKLHAHHILAFSRFPEHRFDVSNGLTLCPECHRKTDNYAGKALK